MKGGERIISTHIKGNCLLVPNTPVEVCRNCGMVYYDAEVLKTIEKRFFEIQKKFEKPDHYMDVPVAAYSEDGGLSGRFKSQGGRTEDGGRRTISLGDENTGMGI